MICFYNDVLILALYVVSRRQALVSILLLRTIIFGNMSIFVSSHNSIAKFENLTSIKKQDSLMGCKAVKFDV
jgi:hypothetical protein